MILREFSVVRFRNVVNSGEIPIADDVTCLVGKNESGKTALLEALKTLNPARPATFDLADQYPRWLLVEDRKTDKATETEPIGAVFELQDADREALEQRFGNGSIGADAVSVSRAYDGTCRSDLAVDEPVAVAALVEETGASPETRALLDLGRFDALADSIAAARNLPDVGEPTLTELAGIESAASQLLGGREFREVVDEAVFELMPKFFYFSDYSILPGRIDLRQIAGNEPPASSELQTAWALLRLADTDTSRLSQEDYEVRKAELEAVSINLTKQVFAYWTQNTELKVDIDIDKATEPTGNGQTAVARYLDVRVRDERHGFTGNFGQRSSGFQWFFSFLAAFSEFESQQGRVVVLLDEPALTLHGRAQMDFLRFINERLAPSHQVIYTTHSPFMVQTDRLERVRIVEDKGPELGAQVSTEVLATDQDSLFPLQAALGYDIAQSLFIGPHNVLVEGTSDFTYLTIVSDSLKKQKRAYLDPDWRLLPCGGAQNIPAFVALLGGHLEVTVLIDSGTAGAQRLTDLGRRGLLEPKRLITVGEVLAAKNADIEDLFDVADYLLIFNGAFGKKLAEAALPLGDRIVKRIAEKSGEFDHGGPADYFLRHRDEILPKLSEATLSRFEKLIERINQTVPA
jgi:predicted ATPase